MKTLFYTKTLIALAVAVAAAASAVSQAQEQPIPPPVADSALPAGIVPGSPLAEVVKMVQAGVDVGTIQSYVVNSPSPFNLDADKIIFLKDEGVPSELVNAMMDRDKILYASTVTTPPVPVNVAPSEADTAPPPTEVTDNYFYDTLTPYGSWLDIQGYGRCWRPTVVIYDSAWHPYCDRGHWVYTDYGWYWDSDYAWGVTFHYGRWFHHPRFGWCWYPDTVWAPSWVIWRSDNDYCGWAPLPPFAVFTPGVGFFYRGLSVGLDFDFGLSADCFVFVSPAHFCDRHPRSFCLAPARVTQIYRQTSVINNFNVSGRTIVNRGIPVNRISSVTHRAIEPVHVASLPNAGRQGWRGEGFQRSLQRSSTDNNVGRNFSSGSSQFRRGSDLRNDVNNNAAVNYRGSYGQATPGAKPGGNQFESPRSTSQFNGQENNRNQNTYQWQHYNAPLATGNNRFQQSQSSSTAAGANASDRRLTQNNWPNGTSERGQPQFRDNDSSVSGESQQHGASQLEQRVEPVTRNYNPPPPPATPQGEARNANSGSNGGSGRGSDQNKQNH